MSAKKKIETVDDVCIYKRILILMIMLQNSQPGRLSDEMEKTIDELYYWRDLATKLQSSIVMMERKQVIARSELFLTPNPILKLEYESSRLPETPVRPLQFDNTSDHDVMSISSSSSGSHNSTPETSAKHLLLSLAFPSDSVKREVGAENFRDQVHAVYFFFL